MSNTLQILRVGESREFVLFADIPRSKFTVDFSTELKAKLGNEANVTNEKALSALKQIKLKSDILWFLTKPVFLITSSLLLFCVGFIFIPFSPWYLLLTRILYGAVMGGIVGVAIFHSYYGFWQSVSKAYAEQSALASRYIQQIEGSRNYTQVALAY